MPPIMGMRHYTLSPYHSLPGTGGGPRPPRLDGLRGPPVGLESHPVLDYDAADPHKACKALITRLSADLDMAQSQLAAARKIAARADPNVTLTPTKDAVNLSLSVRLFPLSPSSLCVFFSTATPP